MSKLTKDPKRVVNEAVTTKQLYDKAREALKRVENPKDSRDAQKAKDEIYDIIHDAIMFKG